MKILFRVDAGGQIGLGHFYRSLNLADQLKKKGHIIIFSHLHSLFWSKITANGFGFENKKLDIDFSEIQTYDFIINNDIDIYYVDGIIDFSETFIENLKGKVKTIFYQNIGDSRQYADIFILPSIHQKIEFFDIFTEKTKIYKGLKYLIFNSSVYQMEQKQIFNTVISDVAITAGGSDPENTLLKIYELINNLNISNINFIFFYGTDYLYRDDIPNNLSSNMKFKLYDLNDILRNDLVISSFGVSTYEFLCLGMPVISFGYKKGNADASDYLAIRTNSFISLGRVDDLTDIVLKNAFEKIGSFEKRVELSNNSKRIIDFKGIKRVIYIIENH